ncbi:acid-sensing ion channel 4 [Plakobranchus ocellatus]|uniref:Acid-sensing ion channel 4 n=1 Tax=Plakobranchus ocellatus TaxID=259542 RepID=A0AAV4CA49_9GAST|nr:acid-sensing ion channel 4 [Plakobranchus ocellatus]
MTITMTKKPVKTAWESQADKVKDFSISTGKKSKQEIKEFAESTTAHGLKNAVSEESSKFRRWAWFLAFLTALTYLTYQLVTCCIDYYRYPIQAQQTLRRMDALNFPTVTICNLNHANAAKVEDPQSVIDIFRVAKGGLWPEALNTTLERMQDSPEYGPYLRRNYKELMEQMSSEVDEIFYFCQWNGEMVSCRDMLVPVWTFIGKCFKLNSNASQSLVATRAGYNGGFFATLKTSLNGHTVSEHSSYGFKALIHHMYDFPDVYSKGLLFGPGSSYHVSFQADMIKYLPHPYKAQSDRYCSEYITADHTEMDMVLNDSIDSGLHSLTACIFNRANTRATKICGCNMDNCTLYDQLSCFEPTFTSIYDTATTMDLLGCPIPCTIHSYRPIISQAAFPAPDLLALDTMMTGNTSYMDRNLYLGLSLFFEDLILREQVHHPVYNTLSLMGMIGGNMGLLLGASLLTLAELLEFLMYLVWRLLPKIKDVTESQT